MKDKVKEVIKNWKKKKEYKRRIEELKKRDPFVYKNF